MIRTPFKFLSMQMNQNPKPNILLTIGLLALFMKACCGDEAQIAGMLTPYEQGDGWESSDYESGIAFYNALAEKHSNVTVHVMDKTDSGFSSVPVSW